jgi:ribose 1,5-bisphosphate isomerase
MVINKFDKICSDIKNVRIQGAEDIAIAAAKALLLRHDKKAIKKLISLRPTEPCLRNTIKFVFSISNVKEGVNKALQHFTLSQKKISEYGSKFIKNGMIVYTHCHSDTVINIFLKAKKQGKKFEVYCTETRPLYQGRITATQLAKAKIPVTMFVDSAARIALKKSDIAFYGCDAITSTKIYNKIGSELFALIMKKYDIPLYVATDSWKFDPKGIYGQEEKIEKRSKNEVWPKAPYNVKISNLAFEKIDPNLVTAIISELGVFMKKSFISTVKEVYPFIFK